MPTTSLKVLQNAAAADGNGVIFRGSDFVRIVAQVTGTFGAGVVWEVSDNGSTWEPVLGTQPGQTTPQSNSLAPMALAFPAWPYFRARIGNYLSGAVTVVAAGMP